MTLSVTHINLFSCLFADFILYNQRNWRITLVYRTTPLDYDTDSRAGWWNGFCRGFALLQARPCELTPLPRQLHPTWDKNFASKPFYSLNFSSRHFTQSHATPRHVTHVTFHCTVLWQSENHNLNLIFLVFLQFPAKTSGTYVQLRRLLMIFVRGRSFARVRLMMRRMMLKLKTVANLPVIVLKVLELLWEIFGLS